MTGPLRLKRCMFCGWPRPGDGLAPGLEALLGEDRVGWLCEACGALPGRAPEFADAVRGLYPGATILTTAAREGWLVRVPLVVPVIPPVTAPLPATPDG